ncbi:MAG TPA: helix-turn-helix domain-containing protein [Candidatus Hydrogenedentes bacterium]|jgi:excisionase family DNA binding protein|nr:helix-turn-helix domain-containing protein [Candidatus Hydrogenedentota bacterium]
MKTLPEKELLRPDEVAEFWSVSVKTIYRWIDLGIIPGVKKGGTVRVPREEAEKGQPVME